MTRAEGCPRAQSLQDGRVRSGEDVELVPEARHFTVKIGNTQHPRGENIMAELRHHQASRFKRPLG